MRTDGAVIERVCFSEIKMTASKVGYWAGTSRAAMTAQ
jgi:hypothetical protein